MDHTRGVEEENRSSMAMQAAVASCEPQESSSFCRHADVGFDQRFTLPPACSHKLPFSKDEARMTFHERQQILRRERIKIRERIFRRSCPALGQSNRKSHEAIPIRRDKGDEIWDGGKRAAQLRESGMLDWGARNSKVKKNAAEVLAKMERVIGKLNERRRIDRLISNSASMPRVEQGSWKDVLSQLNGKSAKLQALPQRRPAWKPESSIASAGKVKKGCKIKKKPEFCLPLPLDIRDMNVIDLEAHRIFLSANGFDQRLRPLSHPDLEEGLAQAAKKTAAKRRKKRTAKKKGGRLKYSSKEKGANKRKMPPKQNQAQRRVVLKPIQNRQTHVDPDALPNRMLLEKDIENRMKTP